MSKFGFSCLFIALSLFETCVAQSRSNKDCGSTLCGNVNIRYPFRLKGQPSECGFHSLELECQNESNRTVLAMKDGNFYVQQIVYENHTIKVVDATLHNCSLPRSSLSYGCEVPYSRLYLFNDGPFSVMYLVNCSIEMKKSKPRDYVDASRCSINGSSYFYFLDGSTKPPDFNPACTIIAEVPIMVQNITNMSTLGIYQNLLMGFEMSWSNYIFGCTAWNDNTGKMIWKPIRDALLDLLNSFAYFLFGGNSVKFGVGGYSTIEKVKYVIWLSTIGGIMFSRFLLGIIILAVLVAYKLQRRHLSADDIIEDFLRRQNELMPIRYSYYQIKRMTRDFKDKLGEGGFGSVFKGKLRSGHLIAVKLLGNSKSNGQDFINEVATIGRIHHVNVAKLVGFCVEDSKQALIYDFMPNGSLDKIIFAEESKTRLSWQKVFDIALGVARGIEYLHRGCDMQILHFDIKPHNILLDESFVPKISDFGLAKRYSVDDSIVSITAARGTIGYIAPELVFKNIGGISYKADVYSFGMLLMEMVGKRRNLNAYDEHVSQRYFPTWIYNQIQQEEDIELGDVNTEEEKNIALKMIIIAFWCVQVKPNDRPSMSKVLEMLETDIKLLQMPPKPFQLPYEVASDGEQGENSSIDDPPTSLISTYESSVDTV